MTVRVMFKLPYFLCKLKREWHTQDQVLYILFQKLRKLGILLHLCCAESFSGKFNQKEKFSIES